MRNFIRRAGRALLSPLTFVWRGEGFVALGAAGGWALLCWGAADLVGPVAWKIGGGLFVLGVGVGWRLLWQIMGDGLYLLSIGEPDEERTGRG